MHNYLKISFSEQTKRDINSKNKQEIAKKLMDDELLDKDPNVG